jgi:hypothetical protein
VSGCFGAGSPSVSIAGKLNPNDIGLTIVVHGIKAKSDDWPLHFITRAVNVSSIVRRVVFFLTVELTTLFGSDLWLQQLLAIGASGVTSDFFEQHAVDWVATVGDSYSTIA